MGHEVEKVMVEHINLWRLLRRITDGESKKVVIKVKDEDGFRAWQRLKQRFEWWPDQPRALEKPLHC